MGTENKELPSRRLHSQAFYPIPHGRNLGNVDTDIDDRRTVGKEYGIEIQPIEIGNVSNSHRPRSHSLRDSRKIGLRKRMSNGFRTSEFLSVADHS